MSVKTIISCSFCKDAVSYDFPDRPPVGWLALDLKTIGEAKTVFVFCPKHLGILTKHIIKMLHKTKRK